MRYAELHCKSNFSFLEGASHPDELVERAADLGYSAIALTDRESVAGVVRGHTPAKERQLQYIVGAEVHPIDTPPMVLWPTDRAAYGQLCRLLSRGRMRAEKGSCELAWSDVAEFSEGILAGLLPQWQRPILANGKRRISFTRFLRTDFREIFDDRSYLMCELHRGVDDGEYVRRLGRLALGNAVPLFGRRWRPLPRTTANADA